MLTGAIAPVTGKFEERGDGTAISPFCVWTSNMSTGIDTQRRAVRPIRRSDAVRLTEIANDARISHMLGSMPHPFTMDDANAFIDTCQQTAERTARFAICEKADPDLLIGCTGFGPATMAGKDPAEIDFGYWLGIAYWGNGYASEAAGACVAHAFDHGGIDQIDTDYLEVNTASGRVLAKLGFEQVGQRSCHSCGSGESRPSHHMRLPRSRYLCLKEQAA
jgi:RimJ/RimL family protein N-acetyltransferase